MILNKLVSMALMLLASGCASASISTPSPSPVISKPAPSPTHTAIASATPVATSSPSPTPTFTAFLTPTGTTQVAGADANLSISLPVTLTLPVVTARQPDPVLAGAGDISGCGDQYNGDEATAKLLDTITGTIVAIGDEAYPAGTADQFTQCYAPTWGRHKSRTRPVPGNHEYASADAIPYFQYFGALAGEPGKGYYSYDLGAWHIIALNSNCGAIGGCGSDSPQVQWLISDLAAHPAACTLAYWHHPRFSSGPHGDNAFVQPLWQALYNAGADVVLNGHDHDYERFAPQQPDGTADPIKGIREFVVGTGGYSLYPFVSQQPNSELRDDSTFGVLKLTLHPAGYDWQFVSVAGGSFTDSGSGACH